MFCRYMFQILGGLVLSPFGFQLQGYSSGITNANLLSTYGSCKLQEAGLGISFLTVVLDMQAGVQCIFVGSAPSNISDIGYEPEDIPSFDPSQCSFAFLYILGYVGASIMLNFMLVLVVSRCSIRLMHGANSMAIPLTCLCFFLFPPSASWNSGSGSLSFIDVIAIGLVWAGIVVYHVNKVCKELMPFCSLIVI